MTRPSRVVFLQEQSRRIGIQKHLVEEPLNTFGLRPPDCPPCRDGRDGCDQKFLWQEIYRRDVEPFTQRITAFERFRATS